MATNPPKGDGHRNGAVRDRSQVQNPVNGNWTKRDKDLVSSWTRRSTESHSRALGEKNMGNNCFALKDCKDLLEKAHWEFDQLYLSRCGKLADYFFLNVILSLNHLLDWVLEDEAGIPLEKRKECLRKFNPYTVDEIPKRKKRDIVAETFLALEGPPKVNQLQRVVRKIANYEKHCTLPNGVESLPMDSQLPCYYIDIDMTTKEERELSEQTIAILEKAKSPLLPHASELLSRPQSILRLEAVSEIIKPLIESWELFVTELESD